MVLALDGDSTINKDLPIRFPIQKNHISATVLFITYNYYRREHDDAS